MAKQGWCRRLPGSMARWAGSWRRRSPAWAMKTGLASSCAARNPAGGCSTTNRGTARAAGARWPLAETGRKPGDSALGRRRPEPALRDVVNKNRAEAFSDGVFAVAATVLVFAILVPDVEEGKLTRALLDEWPSYAAYAISFLTIVVIWVNHHVVFDSMDRVDRPLLFLNALLLLTVAVIPFPTSLLAHYLQAGYEQQAAAFT